jgi:hypothetical protein
MRAPTTRSTLSPRGHTSLLSSSTIACAAQATPRARLRALQTALRATETTHRTSPRSLCVLPLLDCFFSCYCAGGVFACVFERIVVVSMAQIGSGSTLCTAVEVKMTPDTCSGNSLGASSPTLPTGPSPILKFTVRSPGIKTVLNNRLDISHRRNFAPRANSR